MSKSVSSQSLFSEYQQNLEHKAYYLLAGMADKIADSIRAQREAQSLSQCQLADLLGSKQSLVSRLENPAYGKYTLFTLAKVAVALNCELSVHMQPKKKATNTLVDGLPAAAKKQIEKAAKLQGCSISDFVLAAALGQATQVIKQQTIIKLRVEGSMDTTDGLIQKPKSNQKAIDAAKRYRSKKSKAG